MILSIHIPKTAGTTFRELLQAHFLDRICLHYYGPMDYNGARLAEIPARIDCLHGHFTARRFLDRYAHPALVTWLRHPVERVVSEYEHLKRSPDPSSGLSQLIAAGGTLVDFAEHAYARNTQARYIDGVPIEQFAFMGISELFDLELARLAHATGLHLPSGLRSNVNPHKTRLYYPISAAERRQIEALNREDFQLYRSCVAQTTLSVVENVLAA